MKSLRACAILVASAGILALPVASFAQSGANRGSTTSGMFGQTTMGSTSGASPSGLGTGMTTGMSSGATQGGSGAFNSGTGGNSGNNSGFGVVSGASAMQNL